MFGLQDLRRFNSNRLEAVNYYHKALHLGCCSSPRSASVISWTFRVYLNLLQIILLDFLNLKMFIHRNWISIILSFICFSTERHLRTRGFLMISGGLVCRLSKKDIQQRRFFCEFFKIFKNTFFTEHLWATPSICLIYLECFYKIELP